MSCNLLVSIIIPAYNAGKYVFQQLESIILGGFKDYEIIVVDDGSTDNTVQECKRFSNLYSNIYVNIISQSNEGVSKARNEGLKLARGEYVLFVDSDDEILPDMFTVFYNALQKSKYDILIGGVEIKRPSTVEYQRSIDDVSYNGYENVTCLLNKISVSEKDWVMNVLWNKWIRRDLISRNNIHFKDICPGEDYEFLANCFSIAENIFISKELVYRYYIRNNQSLLHRQYNIERIVKRRKCCWAATEEIIKNRKLDRAVFEIAEGFSLYSALYQSLAVEKKRNKRLEIINRFKELSQYYTIRVYFCSRNSFISMIEGKIFDKSEKRIDNYFRAKMWLQKIFRKC